MRHSEAHRRLQAKRKAIGLTKHKTPSYRQILRKAVKDRQKRLVARKMRV